MASFIDNLNNAYTVLFRNPLQTILTFAIENDALSLAMLAISLGANAKIILPDGSGLLSICKSERMARFLHASGAKPRINNQGHSDLERIIAPTLYLDPKIPKLQQYLHVLNNKPHYFNINLATFVLSITKDAAFTKVLHRALLKHDFYFAQGTKYLKFIGNLVDKGADVFDQDIMAATKDLFSIPQNYPLAVRDFYRTILLHLYKNFLITQATPRGNSAHVNKILEYSIKTPLNSLAAFAARFLNKEAASKIIKASNVNSHNQDPLYHAAAVHNLEALQHILICPTVTCINGAAHDAAANYASPKQAKTLELLFTKFPNVKVAQATAAKYLKVSPKYREQQLTLLQHAAVLCTKRQFTELLQQYAPINTQDPNLIFLAIQYGYLETLAVLIANSYAVNQLNHKQLPPLYYAAISNHSNAAEMLNLLINAGADPNIEIVEDSNSILYGQNLLHYLAKHSHPNAALATQRLAKVGINLNMQTKAHFVNDNAKAGNTALHIAVVRGNTELVTMLLQAGAKQLLNHAGKLAIDLITPKTLNFKALLQTFTKFNPKPITTAFTNSGMHTIQPCVNLNQARVTDSGKLFKPH